MTGRTVRNPHIAQNQTSAEGRRGLLQLGRILHHRGVGEDGVDPKGGGMHAKRLQVLLGREAGGLADLGSKVEDDQSAGVGECRALANSGTLRCGSTLVNHEPGPNTTQSASRMAWIASGDTGGFGGTARSSAPGRT